MGAWWMVERKIGSGRAANGGLDARWEQAGQLREVVSLIAGGGTRLVGSCGQAWLAVHPPEPCPSCHRRCSVEHARGEVWWCRQRITVPSTDTETGAVAAARGCASQITVCCLFLATVFSSASLYVYPCKRATAKQTARAWRRTVCRPAAWPIGCMPCDASTCVKCLLYRLKAEPCVKLHAIARLPAAFMHSSCAQSPSCLASCALVCKLGSGGPGTLLSACLQKYSRHDMPASLIPVQKGDQAPGVAG